MAAGKLDVTTSTGGRVTVNINTFCAVCDLESVACTVAEKLPAAAGAPLRAPVVGFSAISEGSAPVATDQLYGGVPPVAVNVLVNNIPFTAERAEGPPIDNGGA